MSVNDQAKAAIADSRTAKGIKLYRLIFSPYPFNFAYIRSELGFGKG
jgi:hypothetical protein